LTGQGLDAGHALVARMQADRVRAAYAFTGQLYLLRSRDLPLAWLARLDGLAPDARPAAEVARLALPEMLDEFCRAGAKAAAPGAKPDRLHAFRLQAKRFRYSLEVFRPFYGPVCDQRITEVRDIQDYLGKRQDCAVTAARLKPLAPLDAAIEALLAKIDARANRLEGEFRAHWNERFAPPLRAAARRRYLARRMPVRRMP
jgi:CHAD domain-containing protein